MDVMQLSRLTAAQISPRPRTRHSIEQLRLEENCMSRHNFASDTFLQQDSTTQVARQSVIETSVVKVSGQTSQEMRDSLAIEGPLEIQLGYGPTGSRKTKSISVTMRTPGNDLELAAGFLMTEGVVHDANDIEHIGYAFTDFSEPREKPQIDAARMAGSRQNTVRVELVADVPVSVANLER